MKIKTALALLLLLAGIRGLALEVPPFSAKIIDNAGVLQSETIASAEKTLLDYEQKNGVEIAVLILKSLQGEVLEEYSIKVARAWNLGQKVEDRGVLLFVAIDDRKLRIEVGRGLEDKLTNTASHLIIQNDITPFFKKNNFDAGIANGVDAIINTINTNQHAEIPQTAEAAPGVYYNKQQEHQITIGDRVSDFFGGLILWLILLYFTATSVLKRNPDWLMYLMFTPFWGLVGGGTFGIDGLWMDGGITGIFIVIVVYLAGVPILIHILSGTKKGEKFFKIIDSLPSLTVEPSSSSGGSKSSRKSSSSSYSSRSRSSSSRSRGSFRGGGASGGW